MKIAIDAMGADLGAKTVVDGCVLALKEVPQLEIHLFGNENEINTLLPKNQKNITVHHTNEIITHEEEPVKAIRSKKDSSLVRAAQFVKSNEADAMITAGNTGAFVAAGLLTIGRIKGIDRPALSPTLPTLTRSGVLLLDAGANLNPSPENLLQYALMGNIYSKYVLGKENPRIGLLNIGTEAKKGTDTHKEAHILLSKANLNFIGNIEARDANTGEVDVIVADGFSGNIYLKSVEGTANLVIKSLKNEITSSFFGKLGALLMRNNLMRLKKNLDYSEYGGALLLGIKSPCIKAHGSSNHIAMKNAILQASKCIQQNTVQKIQQEIEAITQ